MYILYRHIFPQVKVELNKWKQRAAQIPDPELRKQALSSIENKTFHCEGGSVYASALHSHREVLIPLIVAYQTISDYLDNLCDRSTSLHSDNFSALHQSMLDAVSLNSDVQDYYQYNAEKNDGGYLQELVHTCQKSIRQLANYYKVQDSIDQLARLYCDLQIHKHVHVDEREARLLAWWKHHQDKAPDLYWNEFSAATGSTLGIFHLFQIASLEEIEEHRIEQVMQCYFPWVCSLHILLDYLVDLEEDQLGGDLNFISYYANPDHIYKRITYITAQARELANHLPDHSFHQLIIDGLLGLYLSDGKVLRQPMVQGIARALLRSSPLRTRFFFWNSRGYRGSKAMIQSPPQ